MNRYRLDARRLLCPMPVIRVQEQVAEMSPGDRLEVVFSDPGGLHDIPRWCRIHGHRVVETTCHDMEHTVVVEVAGGLTSGGGVRGS